MRLMTSKSESISLSFSYEDVVTLVIPSWVVLDAADKSNSPATVFEEAPGDGGVETGTLSSLANRFSCASASV